jgi:MYXO-CTERM domain-containing protein
MGFPSAPSMMLFFTMFIWYKDCNSSPIKPSNMEKIKRLMSMWLLGFALVIGVPAFAQNDDNDRDRDRTEQNDRDKDDKDDDKLTDEDDNAAMGDNEDDGDGGMWGLLGLAGLLGLLGRKRRDDDRRTTIVGNTGHTGPGGGTGTTFGSTGTNP